MQGAGTYSPRDNDTQLLGIHIREGELQPSVITVVTFEDYLILSDLKPIVVTIAARVWPQSFGAY